MSRCFPYPPPGYVRNPVAVAEAESTAKLQKESGKAEKKKEKRNDKKASHGETSKHSKHSHKKRKHGDIGAPGLEPKTVSKESAEQLEKSGLSEEHGNPFFIQTVLLSPESSQDSSKRRKVVLPSPSQSKNGNILRIKIKSNQESPGSVLEKPRFSEQSLVQQTVSGSSLLSGKNSVQHPNKVSVKSTAAALQRINGDSLVGQKRGITEPHSKIMLGVVSQPVAKVTQQMDSHFNQPARAVQRVDLQPSKTVTTTQQMDPKTPFGRPDQPVRATERVPPAQMAKRVQNQPSKVLQGVDSQLLPPSQIERIAPAGSMKLLQMDTTICQSEATKPSLQKQRETSVIMQELEPVMPLPKEEPCSSGRTGGAALVQEAKQSRSDRKKSRKAEKKEKKFRDLFVTWNPLSMEVQDSDFGEQDWLLGSKLNSDAGTTNCRASDGSVPFPSMEQQPSLQPRATFLPDLHIYQLPFVVPF